MRRLERRPRRYRFMSQTRCRRFAASSQLGRGKTGSELSERQTMEAESRALLHRNRSREVVHCPTRRAEQQHFIARRILIQKRSRFSQTDTCGVDGMDPGGRVRREGGSLHLHPGLHAGTIGYGGASPPECSEFSTRACHAVAMSESQREGGLFFCRVSNGTQEGRP